MDNEGIKPVRLSKVLLGQHWHGSMALVSYQDTNVRGLIMSDGAPWPDIHTGRNDRNIPPHEKQTITHKRSGYRLACIWDETNEINEEDCRRQYMYWLLEKLKGRNFDREVEDLKQNSKLIKYFRKIREEWRTMHQTHGWVFDHAEENWVRACGYPHLSTDRQQQSKRA